MNLLSRNEEEKWSVQQNDDYLNRPLVPRWIFAVFGGICVVAILGVAGVMSWPYWRASQLAKGAERALRRGDLEEALNRIDQAVTLQPKTMKYRFLRGRLRFSSQRYKEAIEDLEACADAGYRSVQCFRTIAVAYKQLGKLDEAVTYHAKELEAATDSLSRMSALNNLSYARAMAEKDLDAALAEIEEAIKIAKSRNGKDRQLFTQMLVAYFDTRGYVYYLMGKYDKALVDMHAAVRGAEKGLATAKTIGGGRSPLALKPIKKQLAVLLYHRGLVFQKQNKAAQAKTDFDRVVELGFHPGKELN